jgi:hypothetical protein
MCFPILLVGGVRCTGSDPALSDQHMPFGVFSVVFQ